MQQKIEAIRRSAQGMESQQNFVRSLNSKEARVTILTANADNFMYLITDLKTNVAAVIDPVNADKVMQAVKDLGVDLQYILTTHSHWDHDGGNANMVKHMSKLKVYGGKGDGVSCVTDEVTGGSIISVGSLKFDVLFTPCHTRGHVCYVLRLGDSPPCAFTGDTLFVAGCGNFNSGTPQMMHDAFKKLSKLPKDTLLFVGHEYTLSNLQYALYTDPKNDFLQAKFKWAKSLQGEKDKHTVPSVLNEEFVTNPFMRAVNGDKHILQHCQTNDTVDALYFVRKEKSGGIWKGKM